MRTIEIPYKPRFPQDEIHKRLESHRFCVLVAHRRMGKTVLAVNHLIKQAIMCRKPDARFAYIAPFRTQAKQIAWSYLKRFTEPIPQTSFNESDLEVTLINKAKIRIYGADNPDALRGGYFDGAVLDEVAQMKPEVWGEIIRPELADRHGWAVFIGTPKGINLFSQLYDRALAEEAKGNADWCAMLYSIRQTHALPEEEVESLRQELSDNEFRQEFLCDFNAENDDILIPIDCVRTAAARQYRPSEYQHAPLVLGVDVARFGGDSSVIFRRQGLAAFEPTVYRKQDHMDNMALADAVANKIAQYHPAAVFIDQGNGTGVIDRLIQLGHQVQEVPFGGKASDDHFANRRAEMWWTMADWLKRGGAIPPSAALMSDLSAPTYGFNQAGRRILEPKDKIKERIGRSPDLADALALTFAAPVGIAAARPPSGETSYDPFSDF